MYGVKRARASHTIHIHQSFLEWVNFSCVLVHPPHRLSHACIVPSGEADFIACSRTRQARDFRAPDLVHCRRGLGLSIPWPQLWTFVARLLDSRACCILCAELKVSIDRSTKSEPSQCCTALPKTILYCDSSGILILTWRIAYTGIGSNSH